MRNLVDFRHRTSGIALVLVLWVLVMLTVMAASFSLNMRREIDLVRNARERSMGAPLAEAGIYYAANRLLQTDPQKQWRSDGSVYEFLFGGARIRVSIHDEAGKIDLNNAPDTLLISLMQRIGLEHEEAAGFVDAIIDWRDADDFRRVNGAEKGEYQDAGFDYGPRNQPFQTIQELRLVLGISGGLYRKLEPIVTVYNDSRGIDPSKSPEKVLRALPGVTDEIIETYLEERAANALNKLPPPPFPVPVQNLEFTQGSGTTFSVSAEARFPDGRQAVVAAVIRKAISTQTPFEFLEWESRFAGDDSLFGESVVVVGQAGKDSL
ncbi:MAG: general secretion pathway protein GspK [Methylococcaceae bacterium]|nr:general secretion pathway protein GspK [Methylococcaceae bacterium]MCI0667863.1 general secretion pathway protein GspK [Methylococcaceae bacterium]MCI0734552.1 general secretion pathway protein GspK [Methylococcaceae bacterium]